MAKRLVICYLVLVMLLIALATRADAFFVTTGMAAVAGERSRDRGKIMELLARTAVETRLLELGFTAAEVKERLAGLTDGQISDLATRLEDLKVGGTAQGVIVGVLIILFVLGVILPLLGIRVWK